MIHALQCYRDDGLCNFSVCALVKALPSLGLEEGYLPAGLCKLMEIKDYFISYHSPVCDRDFIPLLEFFTHHFRCHREGWSGNVMLNPGH